MLRTAEATTVPEVCDATKAQEMFLATEQEHLTKHSPTIFCKRHAGKEIQIIATQCFLHPDNRLSRSGCKQAACKQHAEKFILHKTFLIFSL